MPTAAIDIKSAGSPYSFSFGALADRTVYSNPGNFEVKGVNGYSTREFLGQRFQEGAVALKATMSTSGGAGTAGYAMVPIYVDPRVVDVTRKYTPLVELIPRVSNQGVTADYNRITAKGGGFTAAEDGALAETNTTYARSSTAIKYLYAIGRVTGQAIASFPPYMLAGFMPSSGATGVFNDLGAPNAKQLEVLVKTREIRELEENLIVNGSASTDATQFSGIVTLMSTTNAVVKGGTAIALADIDTAIQYAFDDGGRPNLAIADSVSFTKLLSLLTAKIGYLQPMQQVFWGFSTIVLNTMVGQVPVVPSMYLSNTAAAQSIYFLDMSVVEMRVLQDLTYEELAKTNDSEKFMLKIYEALIIKNTSFCASITGATS